MSKRVLMFLVLCLALILTGCQAGTQKTRKVLPEWSRGQQLGVAALNKPVDMVSEADLVHMIWIAAGGKTLHYVRMDRSGTIELSTDLDIDGAHPSEARMFVNADGSLSALWTDNPNIPRALFLARFSPDGQVLAAPVRLSPEGSRVAAYAVVRGPQGNHHLFWADEIPSEGGIHYLQLGATGEAVVASRLLIPKGENPTVRTATDGSVHLAWVVEPESLLSYVYYGLFDASTGQLSSETQVAMYKTATGLVSYPPTLALEDDTVYLFWSLEQRGGGLSPGEAKTYYVTFHLGAPREMEPMEIGIPALARPAYTATTGSLPYQRLASAQDGWPTTLLYMPATLDRQQEEVGIFLVGEVATQRQTSREVAWAVFADGELKGYQLPTKLGSTLRPTGVVDASGNVHLAWLNTGGFGRYEVYYASTSEAVKANLDRVTLQDRATEVLGVLWSMAPALGFFPPVFLLWAFASFVWVILFYFIKVEGGLDRRPAQIALIVAILLYVGSKLFLMPGPLFYAPFVDRLPSNLQFLPILGTLIFTLLVALGAVWFYFRRRPNRSLFAAYVIFVFTDALLSLLIYVPRWLES